VRRYLRQHDPTAWDFIAALFASPAELAIIPVQDLLGLGSEARMNTPGRIGQNWSWRLGSDQLDSQTAQELRALTAAAGRGPEHLSTRNEDRER
jgi:4-alpha-glucanotransferase